MKTNLNSVANVESINFVASLYNERAIAKSKKKEKKVEKKSKTNLL